ncbi:FKBP-type peptidyl-prolyl cis-trans isomerase [Luteipulveratus halotolerans]|uniref:Peptidyl-prolyl cis-trans isomerase n=1 Tax=Luteipulveratus halotolerans TaxID=1631356 RepID=A0A0L6CHK9_9MICO|nr:FKBP-type peptidyl-prolyl cis-trans isomerase [Luteipulveratus halotolerans]KNX37080.1 peptidylprolyl isomerase [Luteipulveratus halotolerans]
MPFDPSTTKPEIDFPGDNPPAELVIEDITVGDGAEAKAGDAIKAHYVGVAWSTGEEFDASWNRGAPLDFQVGVGQVIQGWDQGIVGMKVGGRRKLIIPPALGYGDQGAGGAIKGGETLIFVVDLVSANKPGAGSAFGLR